MNTKVYPLLAFFMFYVFAYGVYCSPLCEINAAEDFRIEAEYLVSCLGALALPFGLWAIALEGKPKEGPKKWSYENPVKEAFFFSVLFSMLPVILVALTAVNLYSPSVALALGIATFCFDMFLVSVTLYFFKFK